MDCIKIVLVLIQWIGMALVVFVKHLTNILALVHIRTLQEILAEENMPVVLVHHLIAGVIQAKIAFVRHIIHVPEKMKQEALEASVMDFMLNVHVKKVFIGAKASVYVKRMVHQCVFKHK